jgi:hypothetical protein
LEALVVVEPEGAILQHATLPILARQVLPGKEIAEEADLTLPGLQEVEVALPMLGLRLQAATQAQEGMECLSALLEPALSFRVVVVDQIRTSPREELEEQGVVELVEEFLELMAARTLEVAEVELVELTTL